jgi:starch synthase
LNIIYLTTETVPFAKTGGLADVCGALPIRIADLGHRAAVIMPAFASIRQAGLPIESTDISFAMPMGREKVVGCRLLRSSLPDSEVPVWFIDQPQYFNRPTLYGDSSGDFPDNAERFAFFCRAAIMAMTRIGWAVDIVHCNDWQTGLVPALLRATPHRDPGLLHAATVLTIHNLAYQGNFGKQAFEWTGLDWQHFRADSFEYYDQLNFLKTGIVTADMVTTVSPKYAAEIRTSLHGCGLNQVLDGVADRLTGIINGIDETIWNPATDPHLAANYQTSSWRDGKRANKRALQSQLGLEPNDELPLIGLVGRLADQKGWDLILPVLRSHLEQQRPTQWAVLGSGDRSIEHSLTELAARYPGRLGLHIGFSDTLAHRIEAAADLFVMPSHYEPCGLNQLYSLRYGTVPVVTPTGGLADTVVDSSDLTLANRTATGFHLHSFSAEGLDDAIGRALSMRYHQSEKWAQLVESGMSADWSWTTSAKKYVALYERTLSLKANSKPGRAQQSS